MILKPLFTGVCTALITPFRQGKIDFAALDRLIDMQLEAGIPALLPCGTTGEASTLSEAEWRRVIEHTVDKAHGRACVIAGTGSNNLALTTARARMALSLGADAQLVVTPYYNKTTQEGLIDYYTRVADACALPLLLYNVPARTGLNMLPDTAARLAAHPHMIGIKEAGNNLNQLAALLRRCPLPVYCGSDELTVPALQLGACGVISVLSNLYPQAVMQLCAAVEKNCTQTANARQEALAPLIDALFAETSPAPVKAALALLGICSDEVRSPLVTVQPRTLSRLRELLEGASHEAVADLRH